MLAKDFMSRYSVTGTAEHLHDFTEGSTPRRAWRLTFTYPLGRNGNAFELADYSTGTEEADPSLPDALWQIAEVARRGGMTFRELCSEYGWKEGDVERQRWQQ